MSVIHNFRERLEWSAALSDEPAWIDFYRRVWPDMVSATRIDGRCDFQLRGVDRQILRAAGQSIFVDEKKREKDYGDLLLEVWDQVPLADYDEGARRLTVKPIKHGWATDPGKATHFVVYAVPSAGKAYLLPFEILRLTLERCLPEWKRSPAMYPKAARNRDYWTINVAVTWPVLAEEMAATMVQRFTAGGELPEPLCTGTQTSFNWGAD